MFENERGDFTLRDGEKTEEVDRYYEQSAQDDLLEEKTQEVPMDYETHEEKEDFSNPQLDPNKDESPTIVPSGEDDDIEDQKEGFAPGELQAALRKSDEETGGGVEVEDRKAA